MDIMQIEIDTLDAYRYSIVCDDLKIIGQWLSWFAERHISANAQIQPVGRLTIWPTTHAERVSIGDQRFINPQILEDDLLEFANGILALSGKLGEHDCDSPAQPKTL